MADEFCHECKYIDGHADDCPAPLRKQISDLKELVGEALMLAQVIEDETPRCIWCGIEWDMEVVEQAHVRCAFDKFVKRVKEEAVK